MSKQSKARDREEKARRRLTKAQLDLHTAQEKRSQAMARAQEEVERTRLRGAARVEKATQRVERRAGDLARAEARLMAATSTRRPGQQSGRSGTGASASTFPVDTSAGPSHIETHLPPPIEPGSLILPSAQEDETGSPGQSSDRSADPSAW